MVGHKHQTRDAGSGSYCRRLQYKATLVATCTSSLFCCQCSLQEEAVVSDGQLISIQGEW